MFTELHNQIEFALRNLLRWRFPLGEKRVHEMAVSLQSELNSFIRQFNWSIVKFPSEKHIDGPKSSPKASLRVADVGARTFVLAPVFERLFADLGFPSEIHGIEVDAFRRFTNFRSRADYGHYYAKLVKHGEYHAMDFLKWTQDLDVIFLLHPFVTKEPLVQWGLPTRFFQPDKLLAHCVSTLRNRRGRLLLSCPTEEEFEIATRLLVQNGMKLTERHDWHPEKENAKIQKQSRLGGMFIFD